MDATGASVDIGRAASGGASLTDRVALITGASRGIGAVSAKAFAEAGAAVVLASRDERSLGAVAGDIVERGGRAVSVVTDVGDASSVERAVDGALKAYGRLDVAFNNAGDGHVPTPLGEIEVDDFDDAIRVNLRGVFLAMKYELAAMIDGGGAIVNMASTAGLGGAP